MDTVKETAQETFQKFCFEKFVANDGEWKGSKTITREKAEKIIKLLKKDPESNEYSSKFKHWVKERKFQLMTYSGLGLYDVLCLPAKSTVRMLNTISVRTYLLGHFVSFHF